MQSHFVYTCFSGLWDIVDPRDTLKFNSGGSYRFGGAAPTPDKSSRKKKSKPRVPTFDGKRSTPSSASSSDKEQKQSKRRRVAKPQLDDATKKGGSAKRPVNVKRVTDLLSQSSISSRKTGSGSRSRSRSSSVVAGSRSADVNFLQSARASISKVIRSDLVKVRFCVVNFPTW